MPILTSTSAPAPLNPRVQDRSRPVVRCPVELASHIGLKTYNRTFPRVEAALFLAEVVAQLQGRASLEYAAEIGQVNAAIAAELDRLGAFARNEQQRIDRIGKAAAQAGEAHVSYTQPARVELTLRTPRARRYVELLAALEAACRALDSAWYNGAITTLEHLESGNRLFRNYSRACGVIERLARGLAQRVKDDSEVPGYRDMLFKRTRQGPALADSRLPPPVAAPDPDASDSGPPLDMAAGEEDAAAMTPTEANSLEDTEALAAALTTPPDAADPKPSRQRLQAALSPARRPSETPA